LAHPSRPNRKPAVLKRVQKLCLGLPETTEKQAWGGPTFRIRDKMIAMYMDNHHGNGRVALWIKAADGVQQELIDLDPERFFKPPYMGPSGWVGVCLGKNTDWGQVTDLVTEAYRLTAPKKLARLLD
jgi:hypothetical protein